MFLLLDECCGKPLVRIADRSGHTAQRTVEITALGPGASDPEIFEFARQQGAVLVTVNARDFVRLASSDPDHSGLLLIPSLPMSQLRPVFTSLLAVAGPIILTRPGVILEASATGVVSLLHP